MKYTLFKILLLLCSLPVICRSQDQENLLDKATSFPSAFFGKINRQATRMNGELTKQTENYLDRLAKREAKLRKKLYRKDSAAARQLFENNPLDYAGLKEKIQSTTSPLSHYAENSSVPYLDSIRTSLKFLQQSKDFSANKELQTKASASLAELNQLQTKMQITEQVKQIVKKRKEQIQQTLSQFTHLPSGLQNSYKAYSQQAYYYGQQLKQYKEELNDPDKLSKRALTVLNKLPAFQQFLKEHAELTGLFGLPAGYGGMQSLAGLQTRDQVQQLLQNQLSSGSPNAQQMVQQNIQSARTALNNLKDKFAGSGGSDMDMPDFKPNTQKTKKLLDRLEYGFNIQTAKSTYYYPTTSSLAGSIGYKLNGKNTVGIGISYNMGWGKDIKHISFTSQGMGLRSFVEFNLKGSFYGSGGFEYNYQQPNSGSSQIININSWTKSGLIGLTKKYKINNKLKGNLQLLWDFLSYQQAPKTQPIVFRIGYNFK